MRRTSFVLCALCLFPVAAAANPSAGYHPYAPTRDAAKRDASVKRIDFSPEARANGRYLSGKATQPDLSRLDPIMRGEVPADPDGKPLRTGLPDGWVQRGTMVLPSAIDDGSLVVEPDTIFAVTDIPGNKYPRKHTLFLNFNGGMLTSGGDNSAEDVSQLASNGVYPGWTQGMASAVAIGQAVQADFEPFGVTVVYETRPEKVIPYTMEMMGGDWTDTNIDSPAGGVAPGADCGSLGQRHVVYAFSSGSTVQMANTASQEAGHAYGLDHNNDCASVMAYCGGGDGSFREGCSGLCEAACQGPNSAGCQLTHEMFCGVDSFQQNDFEEMRWMFGTNEPDMEAPTAEIVSPTDGDVFEDGADVEFRAMVDDDYGGFGWKYVFTKDGEEFYNQPDYEREVDANYHASVNLGGLEAGVYELRVEVYDHFGHMAQDSVTVTVGVPGETGEDPDTSGGTEDPSGTGDDNNDDGEDESSDGSGGVDPSVGGTGGAGTDPKGCACSSTGPGPDMPISFALAGLVGVLLRPGRKRRTRA